MRYFKQSTCCYQLCSICCSVFKAGWNCAVTIDFNNLSFLEKRFVLFLDTSLPFVAAKTIRFLYICVWKENRCVSSLETEENRHGRSPGRECSWNFCILSFLRLCVPAGGSSLLLSLSALFWGMCGVIFIWVCVVVVLFIFIFFF